MTEYVILKQTKEANHAAGEIEDEYTVVAMLKMRSARAAISKHINGRQEDGVYVAVPSRSFRDVTVKVETKTALKFS